MISPPLDTTPEIAARYRDMLRTRSPSERMVMALGLFDLTRATVLASLPDGCDEAARRVHLFTRTYGRDFDDATTNRIVDRLRQDASDPDARR